MQWLNFIRTTYTYYIDLRVYYSIHPYTHYKIELIKFDDFTQNTIDILSLLIQCLNKDKEVHI